MYSAESPDARNPDSNTSLGPSRGFPAVNVCAAESVFENITFPPRSTVAIPGT